MNKLIHILLTILLPPIADFLKSGDGKAFIHTGGTVVKKELNGEKIIVDTGSLVAFTQGLEGSPFQK